MGKKLLLEDFCFSNWLASNDKELSHLYYSRKHSRDSYRLLPATLLIVDFPTYPINYRNL